MNREPTTELMTAESRAVAIPQQAPPLMTILADAAREGKLEVVKELITLEREIHQRDAEREFYAAKARLHAKLPQIEQSGVVRNKTGGIQSRYAKYEDIDAVLRPLLNEEGFSLEFDSEWTGTQVLMSGTLAHRQGHKETKRLPLPLDTSGAKNNIQGMGSTISYGKRYLVMMLLNIVQKGIDDDGNGGADQTITREQGDEIERLCSATGSDLKKVLEWIGAPSVMEIRSGDHQRVIDALKRKGQR